MVIRRSAILIHLTGKLLNFPAKSYLTRKICSSNGPFGSRSKKEEQPGREKRFGLIRINRITAGRETRWGRPAPPAPGVGGGSGRGGAAGGSDVRRLLAPRGRVAGRWRPAVVAEEVVRLMAAQARKRL